MKKEPVIIMGLIVSLIISLIAVIVVVFGSELEPVQIGVIITFVGVASSLIGAYIVRSLVTPVAYPRDDDGNMLLPERK